MTNAVAPLPSEASPTPSHTPEFRRDADEYRFIWQGHQVELVFRDVSRERGRLGGEVWAYSRIPERPGLFYWGHHGLDSSRSRGDLSRELHDKYQAISVETWSDLVLRASIDTAQAYRSTSASIDLADVPKRTGEYDLFSRWIPLGETTTIYADGESGKSTLGRLLALSVVTGRTIAGFTPTVTGPAMILDYETNQYEYAEGMLALCHGIGLAEIPRGLHYWELQRPLVDELPMLRAEAARLGVVLVFLDSIIAALSGPAKDDDAAKTLMNGMRSFAPATRVLATHITKEAAIGGADGKKVPATSFGSRFFFHYSRSQIEMTKSDERETQDGAEIDTVLVHKKRNRGRKSQPILLRFNFAETDGRISVDRPGQSDAALMGHLSNPEKIRTALRKGAKYLDQLEEITGLTEKTIGATLSRMPDVQRLDRASGLGRSKRALYGLSSERKSNTLDFHRNGVGLSSHAADPNGRFPGDVDAVSENSADEAVF